MDTNSNSPRQRLGSPYRAPLASSRNSVFLQPQSPTRKHHLHTSSSSSFEKENFYDAPQSPLQHHALPPKPRQNSTLSENGSPYATYQYDDDTDSTVFASPSTPTASPRRLRSQASIPVFSPPSSHSYGTQTSPSRLSPTRSVAQLAPEHLLEGEDLTLLRKSATPHLRNLAASAKSSKDSMLHLPGVTEDQEGVTGMMGRLRLQKTEDPVSHMASRNWMDNQRKYIQAYEYLCHIGEAKEWIEACIDDEIPSIINLEEALRDGVILARLTRRFAPHLVPRIFENPKLQYRHTDNINYFFNFLAEIGMPNLFTFELTDLYDKKNIPTVIYCVHALGYLLSNSGLAPPIGNLVGKLHFTEDEIKDTSRGLAAAGLKLPNFSSVGAHFESEAESEPEPEPEISEEEQLLYELTECESEIVELQAIGRGALLRLGIYTDNYILSRSAAQIVMLQSIARGVQARKELQDQVSHVDHYANDLIPLQALARAKLARRDLSYFKSFLQSHEPAILCLQSRIRAIPARKFKQQAKVDLGCTNAPMTKFQAAIRRKLVQRGMSQFKRDLYQEQSPVIGLQSLVRAKQVQRAYSQHKTEMRRRVPDVMELQAAIRGALTRTKLSQEVAAIQDSEEWIADFQSLIRGALVRRHFRSHATRVQSTSTAELALVLQTAARGHTVRKKIEDKKLGLIRFRSEIIFHQANVRGAILRNNFEMFHQEVVAQTPSAILLQGAVRGMLFRKSHNKMMDRLESFAPIFSELQAAIRAIKVHNEYQDMSLDLHETSPLSVELQSMIRGNSVRRDMEGKLAVLKSEDANVMEIQSMFRGALLRKDFDDFARQLDIHTPAVVRLQSIFRGVMTRFNYSLLLEEFDEAEESVVQLQTVIRGSQVRRAHNERMKYFKQNMDKIIKIQSFVRAKRQGDSYKSLISSANPPLATVKNFVHLLNDSDLDFEQEVQLEQSRKQVVDEIQHNEQLEQFINQLDVKIALLLKNKITIDEVIRHRNRGFASHISVTTPADMFDLKAINKSSRKRLELYQGMFYILQTQPDYLSRVFRKLQRAVVSEKEAKEIEAMTLAMFGGVSAPKPREEFFLLKLISRSISDEVAESHSLKTVQRGNFMWWKLLAALNRGPKERKTLRQLLYSSVMGVVSKAELDVESDPLVIYRKSISEEETRTGQLSQRNPNISVNEAIHDPDTRNTYISNMQRLREIAGDFFGAVADNVDMLPYHIRYAARELYTTCKARWSAGDDPAVSAKQMEDKLLSLVGHVVFNLYLNPAIIAADNYGIINAALTPNQTRNLTEITKMLVQVSLLKPFSREDVYLQPLNDFVKSSIVRMRDVFKQVIAVEDPAQHYQYSVYDDVTSHVRPTLYLKTSDIFAIHSMVCREIEEMAPETDDPLRAVVAELGALPNDASEILNIAKFTEIKLELNPSYCSISDPDAEINSLLVSTKRCLIYVLRVQSGANLVDILVSPVEEYHEQKYRDLLTEEHEARERKRKRALEQRQKKREAALKQPKSYNPYLPESSQNAPPSSEPAQADDDDEDDDDDEELPDMYTTNETGLGDLAALSYRELKRLSLERILELESYGKVDRSDNYQALLNSIAFDIKSKRDRRVVRAQEMETARHTLESLTDKEKYLQTKLDTYNDYIEQAMLTLQTKKGGKRKPLLPFSKQYFHMRDLQKTGRVPKFGSYKYSAANMFERGVLVELRGYTEKQYDKLTLTWSSDDVGVFKVEAAFGTVALPGATAELTLDELLNQQYNNRQYIALFDNMMTLNTNLTLHFIFKKFYGEGQSTTIF